MQSFIHFSGPPKMFIAHLNKGQYYSKFSQMTLTESQKYSQFECSLGESVVHDQTYNYKASIAVELLSHEPKQEKDYLYQIWIQRRGTWYNLDNNVQRVFPMPNEPQYPSEDR